MKAGHHLSEIPSCIYKSRAERSGWKRGRRKRGYFIEDGALCKSHLPSFEPVNPRRSATTEIHGSPSSILLAELVTSSHRRHAIRHTARHQHDAAGRGGEEREVVEGVVG